MGFPKENEKISILKLFSFTQLGPSDFHLLLREDISHRSRVRPEAQAEDLIVPACLTEAVCFWNPHTVCFWNPHTVCLWNPHTVCLWTPHTVCL